MLRALRACALNHLRARGARCPQRANSRAVRSSSARFAEQPVMEYQDAVRKLNSLQTIATELEQVRQGRSQPLLQLEAMTGFLLRVGIPVGELDSLNIIHVTGTKGKGSTCAFTERILRNYGFRTGFYSSPHLVQVRERIRINGEPISKDLFTKYFWDVFVRLDATRDACGDSMPSYFRFLTLLAFHVFLQEKVDVAVIEVGIGGVYDCTNIIRKPWVCGVSSLGVDHVSILGDTIEKIAWQKAGIFKPGVPAYTVKQPEGPMSVLQERAREIGCPLLLCPDLEQFEEPGRPLRLGLAGQHQRSNAALALQLCWSWLERHKAPGDPWPLTTTLSKATLFQPPFVMLKGLEHTDWPGRGQIIQNGPLTYYVDGAHTTQSMLACVRWFSAAVCVQEKAAVGPVVRVLLFNTSGERDSAALLKLLVPCQFDFAVFCPNIAEASISSHEDQQNFNVTVENMLDRCLANWSSWRTLTGQVESDLGARRLISDSLPVVVEQRKDALVFPCILSALQWISQGRDSVLPPQDKNKVQMQPTVSSMAMPLREAVLIQVLITGSLHLVGGALKHLDPSLTS